MGDLMELISLAPICILGFLLWRSDRRLDIALKEASRERTALLQRIQAPERAMIEDFEPNDIRHVPFDDDTAYWKDYHGMSNGG